MSAPRNITAKKPVKLIFVGGFLGSGKTTALAFLAGELIRRGMRVGLITNDQTENLVDTLIAREMLQELGVPVEEVVEGCFCCKFDELIDQMEKILAHEPDILMGEPVGSCTDFVAAVANPIKIHYKDSFRFAPFSTLVDPDRVKELLLGETGTAFPEEVSYLFRKQLEEADIIALNKIDLIAPQEAGRISSALEERFPEKAVVSVSSRRGDGMESWLERLLSGKPGANTVLGEIDYDRYAAAEAVLGWLNALFQLTGRDEPFDATILSRNLGMELLKAFKDRNSEIGHLKYVIMSGGKGMWANVTGLGTEPVLSDRKLGKISKGSLILNARVKTEPVELEKTVKAVLNKVFEEMNITYEIQDLQSFSPAYPQPPYLVRETGA
jgi:Ni2+-binding GTPase involved in maturation of urease and hydrogenase